MKGRKKFDGVLKVEGKDVSVGFFRKTIRILLGILALIIVFFVLVQPIWQDLWLRYSLLSALDNAASVRVVEHSSIFDELAHPDHPNVYKEIVFASATLTPDQIVFLRTAIPVTWDYNDGLILKCMFEEHHRIEITRRDGSATTFRICFRCGQSQLDAGEIRVMPQGWEVSLKGFIASLGLHPDGPWDKNPEASK